MINNSVIEKKHNLSISVKINGRDVREWDLERIMNEIEHLSVPGNVLSFDILKKESLIPGIPVNEVGCFRNNQKVTNNEYNFLAYHS